MTTGIHLDLDGAWDATRLPVSIRTIDARAAGPVVRYMVPDCLFATPFKCIDLEAREPFLLYGSGDFHFLAAGWIRWVIERDNMARDMVVVSFDNHPDWDIRPPKWACGGWINRALAYPEVERAVVWGCGNFELAWPSRMWRNRAALRSGKLEVHGWAERQSEKTARRFNCMTRENWRERFARFAAGLKKNAVYVTVDMDCLAAEHALTNWENGLFTPEDVAWGIRTIRENASVVGGDMCGAWSAEEYARTFQRFAAKFDHPKISPRTFEQAREVNHRSLAVIWPALVGERSLQK